MAQAAGRTVVAVSRDEDHRFSKPAAAEIFLREGFGVEGDAHAGATVRHRSRVAADPSQPNLRQVHLIHAELHDELQAEGFTVKPGQLGENITTRGVDLLKLPTGTLLHLGDQAVVKVTGLRNPCRQIDEFQRGLLAAVLDQDEHGHVIRKTGVMSVVLRSGTVRPGDQIGITMPDPPHQPLERV